MGRTMGGLFAALCFGGVFVAGTLSLGEALHLPVPCGASAGCEQVAMHPASRVLGVPLAYIGFAAYVFLAAVVIAGSERLRRLVLPTVVIGGVISGYLLYVSMRVVGVLCPWCVASGAIMASLLVLVVGFAVKRVAVPRPAAWFSWLLAVCAAGGLGAQLGMMRSAGLAPPVAEETLAAVGVDALTASANSIGPADAPITIVEFADFTCPACRIAHESVKAYQERNANAVRWVFRHRPLIGLRGHELGGIAASMSEIAAEKGRFWDFVDAVYAREAWDLEGLYSLMSSLGFDRAEVESRLKTDDDPAILRAVADAEFADEMGVQTTPTFVVILKGFPPKSATGRGLERLLNSEAVLQELILARQKER